MALNPDAVAIIDEKDVPPAPSMDKLISILKQIPTGKAMEATTEVCEQAGLLPISLYGAVHKLKRSGRILPNYTVIQRAKNGKMTFWLVNRRTI
jgi:hypothetical protein